MSANFSIPSVMCTVGTIDTDNILLSVDWPDEQPQEVVDVFNHLPLSLPEREKIAYRNAERVLNLGVIVDWTTLWEVRSLLARSPAPRILFPEIYQQFIGCKDAGQQHGEAADDCQARELG